MNIHSGHRQRLRDRYRTHGLDAFSPHEVLELLLCYALPRGDVNPLAHRLINHFGSLKGVFEASMEQLLSVEGVGPETATLLSMMLPLFRQYQLSAIGEMRYITNKADAIQFCTALLTGQQTEQFHMVCISSNMRLLGHRLIATGSMSEVPAYPRIVVETAMACNAYAVILCHNHPGGVPQPSAADFRVTHTLYSMLNCMNIRLLDHIIVTESHTYSMSQHNELTPPTAPKG